MYSETIVAFQPPPHDWILPMRIAGKDAGRRISLTNRLPLIPYADDASNKSVGSPLTAPTILNNKYHCIPVNSNSMDAKFSPNALPRKGFTTNKMSMGKSAVPGMDCTTSKTGIKSLDADKNQAYRDNEADDSAHPSMPQQLVLKMYPLGNMQPAS